MVATSFTADAGVDASKFSTRIRPDGIVQFAWQPGFAVDSAYAAAAMTAGRRHAAGQKRGVLVDMRTLGPMDRDARAIFVEANDWAYATALWVRSPLSMIVANFFLAVSRAQIPVRMFTDEAGAVAWLTAQRPR
jgi:hypothetical protein